MAEARGIERKGPWRQAGRIAASLIAREALTAEKYRDETDALSREERLPLVARAQHATEAFRWHEIARHLHALARRCQEEADG